MKNISRSKKMLICFLGALLCLFLTWLALGMPALTPGWAFRRACKASFLPKLEVQTVITAKATTAGAADLHVWLAEKDGTIYSTNVYRVNNFGWKANSPLAEIGGTDGIYIVPLLYENLIATDGPHVAVRAPGESAAMTLTLEDGSVWELIPSGREDGWFLFSYDLSLCTRFYSDEFSSSVQPNSPIMHYIYFFNFGHSAFRYPLPARTRYGYTLRFTSFDAAGNVLQEASLEW